MRNPYLILSAIGPTLAVVPVAIHSINETKKPAISIQNESSRAPKFVLTGDSLLGGNPANPSDVEMAYCNIRYFWRVDECDFARDAGNWANEQAKAKFPNDWHTDPSHVNAYRHMLWAAMMTWGLGEGVARGFLDRHELGSSERPGHPDRCADPENNERGISIGKNVFNSGVMDLDVARNAIAAQVGPLIDAGIFTRREDFREDSDHCVSSSISSLGS